MSICLKKVLANVCSYLFIIACLVVLLSSWTWMLSCVEDICLELEYLAFGAIVICVLFTIALQLNSIRAISEALVTFYAIYLTS